MRVATLKREWESETSRLLTEDVAEWTAILRETEKWAGPDLVSDVRACLSESLARLARWRETNAHARIVHFRRAFPDVDYIAGGGE